MMKIKIKIKKREIFFLKKNLMKKEKEREFNQNVNIYKN